MYIIMQARSQEFVMGWAIAGVGSKALGRRKPLGAKLPPAAGSKEVWRRSSQLGDFSTKITLFKLEFLL